MHQAQLARALRALVVLAIVELGSLLFAEAALAQARSIAVYVDGPDVGRMRGAVLEAVGNWTNVVDEGSFRAALTGAGQTKPLGKELDQKSIDRLRRAGRAIGAAAVLVVRVRRDSQGPLALLLLVDISEGAVTTRRVRLDPKSPGKTSDEIAFALGDSLDRYAAQPEPLAKPVPEAPAARVTSPTAATNLPPAVVQATLTHDVRPVPVRSQKTTAQQVATSLLDVTLGGEASGRQLRYASGIEQTSAIYRMFPALTGALSGRVFPLASLGGPWGDIGFAGDYSVTSLREHDLRGATSSAAPTSHSLSACVRAHPGTAARLLVGACVGYAFTSLGPVGAPASELPDVTYRSVRPAVDARVTFGPYSVFGVVAFRAIFDSSAISARFYDPRGYGLDGELGASFMVDRMFEIRLFGRYESYSFDFKPPPGATFGAGSALDQLYGLRLSVAFVY